MLLPDAIPCPASLVDNDGMLVCENAAWREYCAAVGSDHDRPDGSAAWSAVLHAEDRAHVSHWVRSAAPAGKDRPSHASGAAALALALEAVPRHDAVPGLRFEADVRVRHIGGSYRWCRCMAQALIGHHGARWLVVLVDVDDLRAGERRSPEGDRDLVATLASLAHALRNPIQALRHALYVLRLPDLAIDVQQRMLLVQERQVAVLAAVIESHVAAPAAQLADGSATVQSMVGAILRESSHALRSLPHRVIVRMDDPLLGLLVDEGRVARDVGVRWREAMACHADAGRSWLTVHSASGHVDVELVVEPDDAPVGGASAPVPGARRGPSAADARVVYHASILSRSSRP